MSGGLKFGVRAEHIALFDELSADRIVAIVANIGQESLFPPRQDLPTLLALPLPLTGPLFSVRPAYSLDAVR